MADQCAYCRLDTAGDHEIHCRLHPSKFKGGADAHASPPLIGWTCPICGGGMSPFTDRCPCVPLYGQMGILKP